MNDDDVGKQHFFIPVEFHALLEDYAEAIGTLAQMRKPTDIAHWLDVTRQRHRRLLRWMQKQPVDTAHVSVVRVRA